MRLIKINQYLLFQQNILKICKHWTYFIIFIQRWIWCMWKSDIFVSDRGYAKISCTFSLSPTSTTICPSVSFPLKRYAPLFFTVIIFSVISKGTSSYNQSWYFLKLGLQDAKVNVINTKLKNKNTVYIIKSRCK